MAEDAFERLDLAITASADEVRAARRRLALLHHPDVGGDSARMRLVNDAAAAALVHIEGRDGGRVVDPVVNLAPDGPFPDTVTDAMARDAPSFVVEALPAEAFEGLLVATSWLGELLDEDPPYRLDAMLEAPIACWCRLELVPDAGSSTVSLAVAALGNAPAPGVEVVRDAWVDTLNQIDWTEP